MAQISLNDLHKNFDSTVAVGGISLQIAHNEFVVLVGPSGCGKSTTLRLIAGLEEATSGDIYLGKERINEVAAKNRDIAMVFQNYALYPHMTVFENMSLGLRLRKVPRKEIAKRVEEAAKILEIGDLLKRRPGQLSGGQRQRVAMGRAIVRQPQAFLFDEPLSNLDAKLRVLMRTEIKKIHQQVKTTIVYVTHDQVEAMTLADRIVVMNAGLIEQVGTPQDLYDSPETRFVAGFIGSPAMNFISCALEGNGEGLSLRLGGDLVLPVPADRVQQYQPYAGRDMVFCVRPEHLTEKRSEALPQQFDINADVDVVEPLGMDTMVFFECGGAAVCARVSPDAGSRAGQRMELSIDMNKMHLIDPETDRVV